MNREKSRTRTRSNGSGANSSRRNGHRSFSGSAEHTGNGNGHGQKGKPVLITGGAGFIGTNLADRLLSGGSPVILYDNLSRDGIRQNLAWLQRKHGSLVRHELADVRDGGRLRSAVRGASQVFHFAAQVAVTTSLDNPIEDFEINARGTLNLLEALRALDNPPPLVFTSTNKVYGDLSEVRLQKRRDRYEPEDEEVQRHGFDEDCPLHFHSPYGCSKGAACQYVQDYARTFKLPTVVFRMSCIYGPHQFGTEDQGWVAHFLIKSLEGAPLTIYGDGRQVRDILFVEDLVDAFLKVRQHIPDLSGQAFNMGGGPANTISLLELMNLIAQLGCGKPDVRFEGWRPADQLYYVSDTRRFSELTGWAPRVGVEEGVTQLFEWLREHRRAPVERIVSVGAMRRRGNGEVKNISRRSIRPRSPGRNAPRLKNARRLELKGRALEPNLAKAA